MLVPTNRAKRNGSGYPAHHSSLFSIHYSLRESFFHANRPPSPFFISEATLSCENDVFTKHCPVHMHGAVLIGRLYTSLNVCKGVNSFYFVFTLYTLLQAEK